MVKGGVGWGDVWRGGREKSALQGPGLWKPKTKEVLGWTERRERGREAGRTGLRQKVKKREKARSKRDTEYKLPVTK